LLSKKLDMLQAEAINDLINSESERELEVNISQIQGKYKHLYTQLKDELIKMLAHCEAYIDFEADETSDTHLSETF
jgi:tRNA modification GTPase